MEQQEMKHGEHPNARWLNGPARIEIDERNKELEKLGDELDEHEDCPLDPDKPDSGCRLPEAHQCTDALTFNAGFRLMSVWKVAKAWAEWRKGQCDWPKGASPEEVVLIEALTK